MGVMKVNWRCCSILSVLVMVAGLTGCITEVNDPLQQNADPERFVKISIEAGYEYIKEQDVDAAFKHLNRALEKDPKSAEAHNAMALVYRLTEDKEQEEKHFKLAIRYAPHLSKARNNYATFLYREGRYEDALYQLSKAARDPSYNNRGTALVNMGRCYLKLGDQVKAQEAFTNALRADDRLSGAYIELAQIAFEQQQYSQASFYVQKYGQLRRHTPRSLWLGIQVERVLGGKDNLSSYELSLRQLYPNSQEYKAYLQSQ